MNTDYTNLVDFLKVIDEKFSNKAICKFTDVQKKDYDKLLEDLINAHNKGSHCTARKKGELLEEISAFVLEKCGGLFSVQRNVRTHTNELDQLISLSPSGKLLVQNGLLNDYFSNFVCECKNYDKKGLFPKTRG